MTPVCLCLEVCRSSHTSIRGATTSHMCISKGYSCVQCILHRSEVVQVSPAGGAAQSAGRSRGETRPADSSAPSSASPDDTALWTEPALRPNTHKYDWPPRCLWRGPGCTGQAARPSSAGRGRRKPLSPTDAPDMARAAAAEQRWPAESGGHRGWGSSGTSLVGWERRVC